MPKLIPSTFTKYHLSEQELATASIFTESQLALIQNLICEAAEEKVSLTFDPANSQRFLQQEAELQGKIGILKYLLSLHEAATDSTSN